MVVTIDTDKKEIRVSGVNNLRSIADLIDRINQPAMDDYHLIADDRKITSTPKKKKKGNGE